MTVWANTLLGILQLQRFNRGTKWKVRQWDSQTEEDEQEEHRGGAESTSADVNKQWQVTKSQGCSLSFTLESKLNPLKIYWHPGLDSRQSFCFPVSDVQSTVIAAGQKHDTQKITMTNVTKKSYNKAQWCQM